MRKRIIILVALFITTYAYPQNGENWQEYYSQALEQYAQREHDVAEICFHKAQQLFIDEVGLNDKTAITYGEILIYRAYNLINIDDMIDSAYDLFLDSYELSKHIIDTVESKYLLINSLLMLANINLEKCYFRENIELLEKEKVLFDHLNEDVDDDIGFKYYYYQALAETYNHVIVDLQPLGRTPDLVQILNTKYTIYRNGSFYKDYIGAYKELARLSVRINKKNRKKMANDYRVLAEHCRIPDDLFTAEDAFDKAFLCLENIETHEDKDYLQLCNSYLSYCNRVGSTGLSSYPKFKQKISYEFDSLIVDNKTLSYSELMNFYSTRLQDNSLTLEQKGKYINGLCDTLYQLDNILILHFICNYKTDSLTWRSAESIINVINYFSLASLYFYELGDYQKGDFLLNKAKFFSIFLPDGNRLLLNTLNLSIAKSAEIIGDEENLYGYKSIIVMTKVVQGIMPTHKELLGVTNYGSSNNRISKIKEQIDFYGRNNPYNTILLEDYVCLGKAYLENEEYLLAEKSFIIADSIFSIIKKEGNYYEYANQDYLVIKSNLMLYKAHIAYEKGNKQEACNLAKKSNQLMHNIDAIDFLATLYAREGKRTQFDSIIYKEYQQIMSYICNVYIHLSERERSVFMQSKWFKWMVNIPKYIELMPNNTLLLSLAYNSSLITKGTNLLFTSKLHDVSQDDNKNTFEYVIKAYNRVREENANDTIPRTFENRLFLSETYEKEILHGIGDNAKIDLLDIRNWTEIQERLESEEIAIEFIEYKSSNDSGNSNIGALYITKNRPPSFVYICNVKLLDSLSNPTMLKNEKYQSELYNIIWKPILATTMNKVSTIWFSPISYLYFIAIEAVLPDSIMSYRLSSTRNIGKSSDAPDLSFVVLYGGLDYDSKDTSEHFSSKTTPNLTAYNIVRSMQISEERIGLNFLEGSLNEVLAAKEILSSKNNQVLLFTGKNGTEESFKNLSAQGTVSLLHIATHGFYINNTFKSDIPVIGARMMRKSGLFMSGAKAIWKGYKANYSGDDGILLSEEIENTDLSNVNLVVLSACGTGLGNPSRDGVIGLQRAFKKAGVGTIIMSLWNVDDRATELLMNTFYKELLNTQSKSKAFRLAKKVLRQTYEDFYYWAAFIMID